MTSDWCTNCTHHKSVHVDEPPYKSCYARDCQCSGFNSVCDDCSHHPNLKDIQEQMQAKWREAWK